jgi:uncharacterized membrane protein YhhN
VVLLVGVAGTSGSKPSKAQAWYSTCIGIGLILGSGGDFALQLEHDNKDFFIVGLGLFLLSHLAYIAGFWAESASGCFASVPMLGGIAVFAAYAATILAALLPVVPDALRPPVVVYGSVIAMMGVTALSRSWSSSSSWWLSFVGALLFVTSDSFLSLNKFHPDIDTGRMSVMTTYYAAQLLLALSAFAHTTAKSTVKSE